ncbi:glutamate--tRNA ligase [Methylocystis bryophila]|nr:glutamate--tRNA ligase [Methylocystis bryophila]
MAAPVLEEAPTFSSPIDRMSPEVITRFAPSPTGFLHIGSARTALFNWLYARKHGGKMLLRIEDTDRERSTQAAIEAILDGMRWLGLDWDGDAIYQFARAPRHREVAEELLAKGKAYRCFATAAELEEMREKARAEGRPPRYDGRWRDRDPSEAPAGASSVVRLKAPREGETIVGDAVQGRVAFPNKDLDDFVLLRSDGTPTYMLAVVVDDHDMGVTQIIRGDDHFTNAARQTHIYQAMGWDIPAFAHIPLIHGADGAKLSKRHGALGVDAYRALGYLPIALRNYLARLGWSQGDKEFFTPDELIQAFDIAQVHRSPARFDFVKLENMNGHFMRAMADEELLLALIDTLPYLKGGPEALTKLDERKRAQLLAAMSGLKARAKTLNELLDGAAFLFAERPLAPDEKAKSLLTEQGKARLAALAKRLAALPEWSAATSEAAVRETANELSLKLGDLAQPLRAALTGRGVSPPIFEVMEILGREESLARIADQAKG